MIKIWIQAFRPRTLPLAFSCTIVGSSLAYSGHKFSWYVLLLSLSTTLFLQILSNLANDYGDAAHGVDNEKRLGPQRVTQTGLVTKSQMKAMIAVFIILAMVSGTLLIVSSFIGKISMAMLVFFLFGLAAIAAAVKYTIGKKPYGYAGFGDAFVFFFFGIVGVAGTFYLHTHSFDPWILLPAAAIGFLSTGVLNLNNMRDIENDAQSGKHTIVVRIGKKAASLYHTALVTLALASCLVYSTAHAGSSWRFLFIAAVPLFIRNVKVVLGSAEAATLNAELKNLALSTFVFSIVFGLGLVL